MFPEIISISQKEGARIRLPGDLAHAAGWPRNPKEISCFAFLNRPGELMCVPESARTATGEHPFQAVMDKISNSAVLTASELIDSHLLSLSARFAPFLAVWLGKEAAATIELRLGSVPLEWIGWTSTDRPSVYPVIRPQCICLYSQEKIKEVWGSS